MSTNIYVGNIPFTTTSSDLEALFAEFGAVESAVVINDRETGRSRGFGFVEMTTADEANTAISELNGSSVGGRDITVNLARPRN